MPTNRPMRSAKLFVFTALGRGCAVRSNHVVGNGGTVLGLWKIIQQEGCASQ